jgi:hypothetical protein
MFIELFCMLEGEKEYGVGRETITISPLPSLGNIELLVLCLFIMHISYNYTLYLRYKIHLLNIIRLFIHAYNILLKEI